MAIKIIIQTAAYSEKELVDEDNVGYQANFAVEEDTYDDEEEEEDGPLSQPEDDFLKDLSEREQYEEQYQEEPSKERFQEQEFAEKSLDELAREYQQTQDPNLQQALIDDIFTSHIVSDKRNRTFLEKAQEMARKYYLDDDEAQDILTDAFLHTIPRWKPEYGPYKNFLLHTMKGVASHKSFDKHGPVRLDPYIRAISGSDREDDPEVPSFIEDMEASSAEKAQALYFWYNHEYQRPGRVQDAIDYWNGAGRALARSIKDDPHISNEMISSPLAQTTFGKGAIPSLPVQGNEIVSPDFGPRDYQGFRQAQNFFRYVFDNAQKEQIEREKQVKQRGVDVPLGPWEQALQRANSYAKDFGIPNIRTDIFDEPDLPKQETLDQSFYPGQYYLTDEMVQPTRGGKLGLSEFEKREDALGFRVVSPTSKDEDKSFDFTRKELSHANIVEAKDFLERSVGPEILRQSYDKDVFESEQRGEQTGSYEEYVTSLASELALLDEDQWANFSNRILSGAQGEDIEEKEPSQGLELPGREPASFQITRPDDSLLAKSPEAAADIIEGIMRMGQEYDSVPDDQKRALEKKMRAEYEKLGRLVDPALKGPLSSAFRLYRDNPGKLVNKLREMSAKINDPQWGLGRPGPVGTSDYKASRPSEGLATLARMADEMLWRPVDEDTGERMPQEDWDEFGELKYIIANYLGQRGVARNYIPDIYRMFQESGVDDLLNEYELPPEVDVGAKMKSKGREPGKDAVPLDIKQKISMLTREAMSEMLEFFVSPQDYEEYLHSRASQRTASVHTRIARFGLRNRIAKVAGNYDAMKIEYVVDNLYPNGPKALVARMIMSGSGLDNMDDIRALLRKKYPKESEALNKSSLSSMICDVKRTIDKFVGDMDAVA